MTDILPVLNSIAARLERICDCLERSPITPGKVPCRYTLYSWVDEWFAAYRAPVLRDGGYDLKHIIAKHVLSNIQDKPLSDFTSLDITRAINKVASSRMRQIVYQVYNQCFREAVRSGFLDKNPVDNVEHPKHEYESGRSLTRSEEAQFYEAAKGDLCYYLFRFYPLSGCRPSEALYIVEKDVGDELLHIPGTKTSHADRQIPISPPLRELLNVVLALPRKDNRLFPFVYHTVARHLELVLRRLPFDFTVKDLRHTFGTRCIEAGVSMKTVQKWMGHSKYEITANTYAHVLTEFERLEAQKLCHNSS